MHFGESFVGLFLVVFELFFGAIIRCILVRFAGYFCFCCFLVILGAFWVRLVGYFSGTARDRGRLPTARHLVANSHK